MLHFVIFQRLSFLRNGSRASLPGGTACTAVIGLILLLCSTTIWTPAWAQEETEFVQGSERYPARVIPGRIALVINPELLETPASFALIQKLRRQYTITESDGVIEVAAEGFTDAGALAAFADKVTRENAGDIVAGGFYITVGVSESLLVVTDQIIVQLKEGTPPEAIREIAEAANASVVGTNPYDTHQFFLSVAPDGQRNALEAANALNGRDDVEFAHPNFLRAAESRQAFPNDPFFPYQWHLRNTGQGAGTAGADIDAVRAWSFGRGDPGILIAIIDDGFELDHPDLAGAVWTNLDDGDGDGVDDDGNGAADDVHGWDFTGCFLAPPCGDPDVSPRLAHYHGTAVAGAAVARADNGIGVAGTCPECKFLPVRTRLNSSASSDLARELAIHYAGATGARIISNSWGYPFGTPVPLNVRKAISDVTAGMNGHPGAVVLFGAPNQVLDACSAEPRDIASLPDVVGVSGSTNGDRFFAGGYGDCLDILAPTDGGTRRFVTTDVDTVAGFNNLHHPVQCALSEPSPFEDPQREYTFCAGGTSFSAPQVAGAAGLVLSADPTLTREEVQRLLQDTADKISDSIGAYGEATGFSEPVAPAPAYYAYGRLNAYEAVRTIADPSSGGRGGVDLFLRDNRLDWGNTAEPSNVSLEAVHRFIAHYNSVDIKIDAPPFLPATPDSAAEFSAFLDEDPQSGMLNRVYVRVRNRGPRPAEDVTVKLHWAFAGAGLPALPADFWSAFPADASDTSTWRPLGVNTIATVPYSGASVAGGPADAAVVVAFNFDAPDLDPSAADPEHYSLFAIVDAPDDPVWARDPPSEASQTELVPDLVTPNDNNVTQRSVTLIDANNPLAISRLNLVNPFEETIETRLVAATPKGWKLDFGGRTDTTDDESGTTATGQLITLQPHEVRGIDVAIVPGGEGIATIDVHQLYRLEEMQDEEILGGMTYRVAPRISPEFRRAFEQAATAESRLADEIEALTAAIASGSIDEGDRAMIHSILQLLTERSRLTEAVR